MQAAIYRGPGKITIEDIPVPETGGTEILVEVKASGICGTDVKTYLRGHRYFEPPCILGHEFSGVIVRVGAEATGFEEGDRVAVAPYVSCGHCSFCQEGMGELCTAKSRVGSGAFTEYVLVPREVQEQGTVILPDNLDFAQAAMAEPLACVINGIEDCKIELGSSVLILGAGPMGLLHAQTARARGARVVVSDTNEERLSLASRMGIPTVNPRVGDVSAVMREGLGEAKARNVIVCAGSVEAAEEAFRYIAPGGVVNLFGGLPKDAKLSVDPGLIHYQQVTLVGSFGFTPRQFRQAVNLLAGGLVDVAPIISHRLPLSEVERGLKMATNQKAVKVILVNEG